MKSICTWIGILIGICLGFSLVNQIDTLACIFPLIGIGLGYFIGCHIETKKESNRRFLEELERKKRIDKEKEKKILEAQNIIQEYPKATKHFFTKYGSPGLSREYYEIILENSLDEKLASFILNLKNDFEKYELAHNADYRAKIAAEKQEKIRREAAEREVIRQTELAQQRAREQRIQNLPNKVATWNKFHSLPYYFFYYYYPTRFTDVSSESKKARRLIWNFKDGIPITPPVYKLVGDKLKETFTGDELKELTFVGTPASTRQTHKDRYENFCKKLCDYTGMQNAYPHITIEKEKTPKHLSPTHESEPPVYEFNRPFFQDARVIIFDDVVTKGTSLLRMKLTLEKKFGCSIIGAISLGRTYSDYSGDNRLPHPYSGIL